MANRLNVLLTGGSGSVNLYPQPGDSGMYDNGVIVAVTLTLDSGYTFINWTVNGVEVGTDEIVNITMGRSDILLLANIEGTAVADFTYGPRLLTEYVDITNKKTRLVIEEKNYVGDVFNIKADSLIYSIGNFDSSPVDVFVTSSVRWNYVIEKNEIDLDFLLTSDPRQFRVKYYRDYISDSEYAFYWVGYLKTSFFEKPEYKTTYKIDFTATDGQKDLESYRTRVNDLNFTDAMTVIASLLKVTHKDPLPIKECVRVFETRMNSASNHSVFNQYFINSNFIYSDEVRFQADGDQIVFNPTKKVYESIESCIKSFVTRVFQWNGYWYIMRVFEYQKDVLRISNYDTDGVYIDFEDVLNNQTFECIGNPVRRGENDYTEFNASLKLGSIDRPEERSIASDKFGILSWINPNPGRPSTIFNSGNTLRFWIYINAIQYDGNIDSDTARVEHVSNPTSGVHGEFPRFWGTANGIDDVNISGISWRTLEYNGVVKNADTITINAQFQVLRRGRADRLVPAPGSHVAALQVKIGLNYLEWDGIYTFTWTTTPTKIIIPIENTEVFNDVVIPEVVVPVDGYIELSLYQLVTVSGTRHRYVIDWDNIDVNLKANSDLLYSERKAKATTGKQYSSVYPAFDTHLGDALTDLSSSAMILKNEEEEYPVTSQWRRAGESESEPLLGLILQDLVNIFGKNNYTITAAILERESGTLDFSKGITYRNKKCIILGAQLNDRLGLWNFQFYQLDPESNAVSISWSLSEWDQEGEFIDANMRIFVNESMVVEAFGSSSGSIDVLIEDVIRVQYFYIANLYAGNPGIPRLNLSIDGNITQINPLVLTQSKTVNYSFTVTQNSSSISVASINASIIWP